MQANGCPCIRSRVQGACRLVGVCVLRCCCGGHTRGVLTMPAPKHLPHRTLQVAALCGVHCLNVLLQVCVGGGAEGCMRRN